ncbi:MAG: F0F1 ATP synthase subunit beta, partial [Spirochaetes bacterium]
MNKEIRTGKVVQILGPVIDVRFDSGNLPEIYTALTATNPSISDKENNLVLEVVQHIGDNTTRTIAMDSTDGLKRGISVVDTGEQITVPVGEETLGRIMDVTGKPVDEQGELKSKTRYPIHRPAPKFDELSTSNEILVTGIKVVDLLAPYMKGGKIGLFGGAGVGKTVLIMELIN